MIFRYPKYTLLILIIAILAGLAIPLFGQGYTFRDPSVQIPVTTVVATVAPTFVRSGTNSSASATTLTISAFSVTGSNPYLIVGVTERSSLAIRAPSVTANGIAMVQLYGTNYTDTKGSNVLFGLAGPTTGDIVVTLTGAANSGFAVTALLFNGCQTVGMGIADYSVASRAAVSVAPTSLTTDLVVDLLAFSWTTVSGAQTIRSTTSVGTTTGMSTATGSAGSTTMSWSGASSVVAQTAVVLHGL